MVIHTKRGLSLVVSIRYRQILRFYAVPSWQDSSIQRQKDLHRYAALRRINFYFYVICN